jgi:DNA-binding NarL/FixJ family response regulator
MNAHSAARTIALIVDDTPETLSVLIDTIEAAGITALVARDGNSALALVDRISPDVVLLDALMPGIDGFETCRRLKARPDFVATPIIFMTGLTDSAHVLEGLRAGGVDYVTKPINPDELIARIAIHIANARLIEDARRALDAAGQAVISIRPDATLAWASPRARDLLRAVLPGEGAAEALARNSAFARWVDLVRTRPVSQTVDLALGDTTAGGVSLTMMAQLGTGDILARVAPTGTEPPEAVLSRELGLSLREAEVLYWLSEGKSNRDIADILGLSPRTVMKHVEQLLAKLGVENRTAAASLGIKKIMQS